MFTDFHPAMAVNDHVRADKHMAAYLNVPAPWVQFHSLPDLTLGADSNSAWRKPMWLVTQRNTRAKRTFPI
jgi:hypothetical protein